MPSAKKLGSLSVEPAAVVLTGADQSFRLRLSSDSNEPVSYRVVSSAGYLKVATPRGTFSGSATVQVDVAPLAPGVASDTGALRVITSVGEVAVSAPIRLGMGGRYEGALKYSVGGVSLGDARLVLDLAEDHGDISVRVDPEQSLLFPADDGTPTYGQGVFTETDGMQFSLRHVMPVAAAGDPSDFGRPIGRELTVHLRPTGPGVLEGTFEERVHGLLPQAPTLTGTLSLTSRPSDAAPEFLQPAAVEMPRIGELEANLDALGGASQTFGAVTAAVGNCDPIGVRPGECLPRADDLFYQPFRDAFATTRTDALPLSDLVQDCADSLHLSAAEFVMLPESERKCANQAGTASVMLTLLSASNPHDHDAAVLFHRATARLLAPALLVAQDALIRAVRESFTSGIDAQRARYEEASEALRAPAAFLLQPGVLEFLRNTSLADAQGSPDSSDPTEVDFPGLRALRRLLYVQGLIAEEVSALSASSRGANTNELAQSVQERAVLTLARAASLAALVDDPDAAIPAAGDYLGALTPLNRGLISLSQGGVVFGAAEGEIPMAYDPKRAPMTNFEQMLLTRAQPSLHAQAQTEASFTAALRDYEQTDERLSGELAAVRVGQEETLAAICGDSFDVSNVQADPDWGACGADGTGSLAAALLDIELRSAEVHSAQVRVSGMTKKIVLAQQTLKQSQRLRERTLAFIDQTGHHIELTMQMENLLEASVQAIEIAAHASLWNAGAPLAEAIVAGMLTVTKGQYEVQRYNLERAQSMRIQDEGLQLEEIQGLANIQAQFVDLNQLQVDIEQSNIVLLQSTLAANNLLEVAKRAAVERERTLERISSASYSDPLYRLILDQTSLQALGARRDAQRWLYRAGRALEYEINTPLGEALDAAILAANNEREMTRLSDCLLSVHNEYQAEFGVPQDFRTTVSVRELLGISGPRLDEVTGQLLSEGELFRHALLQNQNLGVDGGVTLEFSTNLEPGNGLWSSGVCDDKMTSVRAELVGDFLGDAEAELRLEVEGGAVMRRCDGEELWTWRIDSPDVAVLQAGVNSMEQALPSWTLGGQSVARPRWKLHIPGGSEAPANSDLEVTQLEDIVLEVSHQALPVPSQSTPISLSCLTAIGTHG